MSERGGGGVLSVHLRRRRRSCSASTSWTELSKPRDLEKIFDTVEYTKWKSFRDSEDSRFVTLTMPRTLGAAALRRATPSRSTSSTSKKSHWASKGKSIAVPHDQYCWMNAAYVMGTKLTDAFAKYGLCTAIRGAEGGGKVEGLPAHIFTSDDGDMDLKCPTEIAHHRSPRSGTEQAGIPAAVPLQEHRLRRVLRCPDARRSRRSTIGRRRPPTRRSRPGCPTSWRPRGSPTT